MSLAPGTQLGCYEVVALLGAGGMGEVYRARDTRLHRDVAIKTLPELFASDPERLSRFEREARTLAALNHTHIAHIYGIEGAALIMELVEGEDLSAVLSGGALPLDEAIRIAAQMADALECAHDLGIVHRDLKPANIKVRADGTIKVLDFGLAKAFGAETGSNEGLANSPTITNPATEAGVILGTAAYMSPEQAKGRAVDKRADIWAFGVILFEMLTGRRLFEGGAVTEILASVLRLDIPWHRLPSTTPPPIVALLKRCIDRDPKTRLRDIGEARVALAAASGGESPPAEVPVTVRRRNAWLSHAVVAVAAALVMLAIGFVLDRKAAPLVAPIRLQLELPLGTRNIEVSPDGKVILAWGRVGGIHVRAVESGAWRKIPGVDTVASAFWAPDSRWVGFVAQESIAKVDLVGSRPETICDGCVALNGHRGLSWAPNGEILVGQGGDEGIVAIRVSDGAKRALTKPDRATGESHRFPWMMPDRRRFLFAARQNSGESWIMLGSLDGAPAVRLVSAFSRSFVAAGHLVFARGESLLAQPFDDRTGAVSGEPITLSADVWHDAGSGVATFSVGGGSLLGLAPNEASAGFAWVDQTGRVVERVAGHADDRGAPRVSPDGRRIVVARLDRLRGSTDIYVVDLETRAEIRISSDLAWDQTPIWSADGSSVFYRSMRDGVRGVWTRAADASTAERLVAGGLPAGEGQLAASPTGKFLVVMSAEGQMSRIALPGGKTFEPWLADARGPAFSPNGRWVAYASRETGGPQVHVRSTEGTAPVVARMAIAGGSRTASWSRDGKRLFFIAIAPGAGEDRASGELASVDVTEDPVFRLGTPVTHFNTRTARVAATSLFDIDAQGRALLQLVPTLGVPALSEVIVNWPMLLRRER